MKAKKPLMPQDVKDEHQAHYDFSNQVIRRSGWSTGLFIRVTCPTCHRSRWQLVSDIRGKGYGPHCSSRCFQSKGYTLKMGYKCLLVSQLPPKDQVLAKAMATAKGHYIREHRLVMARFLQRPLGRREFVHHRNGNKLDNCLSNLQLLAPHEHHAKSAIAKAKAAADRRDARALTKTALRHVRKTAQGLLEQGIKLEAILQALDQLS